mmetsp:Transcript_20852/g.32183  ORF Transcript_20852/g.32183 Transcript_20852/m.32183 type:complete len:95 (-) Transcript_20852:1901-2185(-)
MSDLDERSDNNFSNIQSIIPGITASEISGFQRLDSNKPRGSHVNPKNLKQNSTIKEENEDFEQSHMLPAGNKPKEQFKSIEVEEAGDTQEYRFI